jgi:hypothetical protein
MWSSDQNNLIAFKSRVGLSVPRNLLIRCVMYLIVLIVRVIAEGLHLAVSPMIKWLVLNALIGTVRHDMERANVARLG